MALLQCCTEKFSMRSPTHVRPRGRGLITPHGILLYLAVEGDCQLSDNCLLHLLSFGPCAAGAKGGASLSERADGGGSVCHSVALLLLAD